MAVDRKASKSQKSDIRKRTPLEQAIAEQTDRRARHDAKKVSMGLKRTTFWVRPEALDRIREFINSVNSEAPGGRCHD